MKADGEAVVEAPVEDDEEEEVEQSAPFPRSVGTARGASRLLASGPERSTLNSRSQIGSLLGKEPHHG